MVHGLIVVSDFAAWLVVLDYCNWLCLVGFVLGGFVWFGWL